MVAFSVAIRSAPLVGAVDVLVDALEHLLDLLVQFRAVGDDQHAGILHVLANPLGQPDHRQALARALGVPDDAALAPLHVILRGPHAEILVVAAELLGPGVEDDEVVDQLQEAGLAAQLGQRPVQRVFDRAVFLPGQVILLRRLDRAVAQALGVVARHDQLHRGEEGLDEDLLLVVQVLADALGHRNGGALQFQHAKRDAVDVEHHVRPLGVGLGVCACDGDLLGDGEVVLLRVLPVDQPDGLRVFAHIGLHLHAIAEQVIDRPVAVVEALAGVASRFARAGAAPA